MENIFIIGITGKARSGKDTFAKMLADALFDATKQHFVLMAYAHELKLRVQRDFDLDYEQLWGDSKEEYDKRYPKYSKFIEGVEGLKCDATTAPIEWWTGREILQSYGQFFRIIDKDFWVKNLFNTIETKNYSNVIVTDVRHPNEADAIKAVDGFVIKVQSNREDIQQIHGISHISETAMDTYNDIDLTVVNDWGLKELSVSALTAVDFILTTKNLK